MRANVKPLTHWAIYKSYKMRITQRATDEVSGIFTVPDGQIRFRYDASRMIIYLADHAHLESVAINEYGWEVGQTAAKSEK